MDNSESLVLAAIAFVLALAAFILSIVAILS